MRCCRSVAPGIAYRADVERRRVVAGRIERAAAQRCPCCRRRRPARSRPRAAPRSALSKTRLPPDPPQELLTTWGRRSVFGVLRRSDRSAPASTGGGQRRGRRTVVRDTGDRVDPPRAGRDADVSVGRLVAGRDAGDVGAVADGGAGIGVRIAGSGRRVVAEARRGCTSCSCGPPCQRSRSSRGTAPSAPGDPTGRRCRRRR